jgi:hypothetical protein
MQAPFEKKHMIKLNVYNYTRIIYNILLVGVSSKIVPTHCCAEKDLLKRLVDNLIISIARNTLAFISFDCFALQILGVKITK